jgi:UPF0271 protein
MNSHIASGIKAIDLNCDMGEGMPTDKDIMPLISSANIACGYHAGDEKTIWDTIEMSLQHEVAVGAHVSFFDRKNFGRKEINISKEEIYDLVTQQLVVLNEMAGFLDTTLHHVKPHGALYNLSAKDPEIALSIAQAIKDFDGTLILYGLSGSHSISEAKKAGLKTAGEVFADRAYMDDGSLVPRSEKSALLENTGQVLKQVLQMITQQTVTALSGKQVPVIAETICIHGDGELAVEFSKAIHKHLKQHNIAIQAI